MVVVVFWSYGCEASLLRVRQVEALVDSTGGAAVAIGVHTPRFPYEEQVADVRSALAEHRISIPVVHDPDYVSWNRYNPEGWPATVVIDARGRVLGSQSGTDDINMIVNSVALGLKTANALTRKLDDLGPVPAARPLPIPTTDLAFPASVTLRSNGDLVVADTANDRLLIFELSADLKEATAAAEIDGFDRPNCVIADPFTDGIYVAERAIGAVSFLDLVNKRRQLLTDDLIAPTGLAIDNDGSLVVTDGGAEKIYRIINNGPHAVTMGLIAGSGSTGGNDGPAGEADLAQPSGIARTEVGLVFCDAASSNIRLLTDSGKVATITGNGFFEFGLVDGPAHKAMLQRPSDLTVLEDGSIIIVDSGNHRLRRLANRRIRTLGLAGLDRPTGVCLLSSGQLIVADTGNHQLVAVDADLQTAWAIRLNGVLPPPSLDELNAGSVSSPAV